jgi:hypothetical protein
MIILYKITNLEFNRSYEVEGEDNFLERKNQGDYGKEARWIRLDQATEWEKTREDDRREVLDQEAIPEYLEEEKDENGNPTGNTILVPSQPAKYHTEIHVPDDFIFTITDVTAEYEAKIELQKEIKKREAGSVILAFINTVNNSKNYTSQQYIQMLNDSTVSFIKVMLESGALGSARDTLLLYQPNEIIDQNYIDKVVSFINMKIGELNG